VLVVLRRLDALIALVGHDGLLDGEPRVLRVEVEVTNAQARQLAPAQAAICEHEDDEAVAVLAAVLRLVNGLGERGDLIVGQVTLARLGRLRELEPLRRVGGQPPVLDREPQRAREHVHDLPHRGGGAGERRGPLLHAQSREVADRGLPQLGDDVLVDDVLDPAAGRRPEVAAGGEPGGEPFGQGHPCSRGVEVAALGDVDLRGRQEQLGRFLVVKPRFCVCFLSGRR